MSEITYTPQESHWFSEIPLSCFRLRFFSLLKRLLSLSWLSLCRLEVSLPKVWRTYQEHGQLEHLLFNGENMTTGESCSQLTCWLLSFPLTTNVVVCFKPHRHCSQFSTQLTENGHFSNKLETNFQIFHFKFVVNLWNCGISLRVGWRFLRNDAKYWRFEQVSLSLGRKLWRLRTLTRQRSFFLLKFSYSVFIIWNNLWFIKNALFFGYLRANAERRWSKIGSIWPNKATCKFRSFHVWQTSP